MLYPQIPKPLLKRIASSLSIDLKLFGAEVSLGAKGNQPEDILYSKTKIVSEYIEKHLDVGSVDVPSTYIKGRLSMQQGTLMKQAVYFGGTTERTILGLSGSMKHVIGGNRNMGSEISLPPSLFYGIMPIIEAALIESNLQPDNATSPITDEQDHTLRGVAIITKEEIRGPRQHFEFLAKTLLQGSIRLPNSQSYVVLGTPIYVALAD